MIRELDFVVLACEVEGYDLKEGDVGIVIHCFDENYAFTVQFVTGDGKTIAIVPLLQEDIRPMHGREILHVRELEPPQDNPSARDEDR